MIRRLTLLVVTLVTALIVVTATPAAARETTGHRPSGAPFLSYTEGACTEVAYQRGGLTSAVRPLVPARFALTDFPGVPENAPARVYLYVNEVTCARRPADPDSGRYTFVIVSAPVTATEGDQRDGAYVLFWATENRSLLNAFRRLGWPVAALSGRTSAQDTVATDGAILGTALHVVGGGWDHDLSAIASGPASAVTSSTAAYYRDTARGPRTVCYANRISQTAALYSGDLRGTPLAEIAYVPPLFVGYGAWLVRGGWDVTVTAGACPA